MAPTEPTNALRVSTGARLHFGLLRTASPFGGLGVMIDSPCTEVLIAPATQFEVQANEDARERIQSIAERIASHFQLSELPACRVQVLGASVAHHGLGSGTQLALAATDGILRCCGLDADHETIAVTLAARGRRSAVGIHGYFEGGLIFEAASNVPEANPTLNPIQRRVEVPQAWRVALFRPQENVAIVSGEVELEKFKHSTRDLSNTTSALTDITEQEIIPAIISRDFPHFATAVERFNRMSGMLFESVQGGPYNGPTITNLVNHLKSCGAQGIGQSSWGPTVFAWFESHASASEFIEHFTPASRASQSIVGSIARPINQPRILAQTTTIP